MYYTLPIFLHLTSEYALPSVGISLFPELNSSHLYSLIIYHLLREVHSPKIKPATS